MRIAILGDLHYSARLLTRYPAHRAARDRAFDALVRRFFAVEADWYVSIGDLVNEGRAADYDGIYRLIRRYAPASSPEKGALQVGPSSIARPKLERRFIHVLGNHDVLLLRKEDVEARIDQPRNFSIDVPEARLIFLDTTKARKWYDWGGTLDRETLAWLSAELRAAGDRPALVFAHHPVHNTTARSAGDRRSIDAEVPIEPVLAEKRGLNLFFSGHNHVDSIARRPHWLHVQTAAALDTLTIRLVDLSGGRIRLRLVPIGTPEMMADVGRFARHMRGFRPGEGGAFGPLDEAYVSIERPMAAPVPEPAWAPARAAEA